MPDKSAHKERTRARILDEAAKALRELGHERIGVADVMKRAGLTHGGFYAHFKNRDDLIAATIDRAFEDSKAMVARNSRPGDPRGSLSSLIDDYLSDGHRRKTGTGCPVAALGSEAARMPEPARSRFEQGMGGLRGTFIRGLTELGAEDPEAMAASAVAEMIGALTISRAIRDDSKAGKLLERSREQLKRRLGLTEVSASGTARR